VLLAVLEELLKLRAIGGLGGLPLLFCVARLWFSTCSADDTLV
jgi:hypothetical protein